MCVEHPGALANGQDPVDLKLAFDIGGDLMKAVFEKAELTSVLRWGARHIVVESFADEGGMRAGILGAQSNGTLPQCNFAEASDVLTAVSWIPRWLKSFGPVEEELSHGDSLIDGYDLLSITLQERDRLEQWMRDHHTADDFLDNPEGHTASQARYATRKNLTQDKLAPSILFRRSVVPFDISDPKNRTYRTLDCAIGPRHFAWQCFFDWIEAHYLFGWAIVLPMVLYYFVLWVFARGEVVSEGVRIVVMNGLDGIDVGDEDQKKELFRQLLAKDSRKKRRRKKNKRSGERKRKHKRRRRRKRRKEARNQESAQHETCSDSESSSSADDDFCESSSSNDSDNKPENVILPTIQEEDAVAEEEEKDLEERGDGAESEEGDFSEEEEEEGE